MSPPLVNINTIVIIASIIEQNTSCGRFITDKIKHVWNYYTAFTVFWLSYWSLLDYYSLGTDIGASISECTLVTSRGGCFFNPYKMEQHPWVNDSPTGYQCVLPNNATTLHKIHTSEYSNPALGNTRTQTTIKHRLLGAVTCYSKNIVFFIKHVLGKNCLDKKCHNSFFQNEYFWTTKTALILFFSHFF